MPLELLSDDPLQEPGLSDIRADSFEQDSAALEFNKVHDIRQKARQLCMQTMAKDKVSLSSQGHLHRQRQWFPGVQDSGSLCGVALLALVKATSRDVDGPDLDWF